VEAFVDAVQDAMGGHIADVVSARSVGSGEFGAPGEPGSFRVKL
jgi:hypothetical protein